MRNSCTIRRFGTTLNLLPIFAVRESGVVAQGTAQCGLATTSNDVTVNPDATQLYGGQVANSQTPTGFTIPAYSEPYEPLPTVYPNDTQVSVNSTGKICQMTHAESDLTAGLFSITDVEGTKVTDAPLANPIWIPLGRIGLNHRRRGFNEVPERGARISR